MALIRAAGGLVWRSGPDGPRLAVIHRPRREDWSLPRGKLVEGESWASAAVREVREETGCVVRLGTFAGSTWYVPRKTPKVVLFWHMELVRQGRLDARGEVDEVAWLTPREALQRLDHGNERAMLRRALAPRRGAPAVLRPARAEIRAHRTRVLRRALSPEEVDGEAVGRLLARLERAERCLDEGDHGRARLLIDRAGRALGHLARAG